ncbi:MAG: proton-conducting membrane transporter, partial [Candidatus Latescibacteria bacterium]|nr:proton-conducting membrane transporter [Candidatus Latescibacterota bacterium]
MTIEKDKIYSDIDLIVSETGTVESAVIPILHAIQKKYNYLPETALRRVCDTTDVTPASITGVSTFYTQFRHAPVGNHIIHICNGTACHVKGSERVYDAFFRELSIKENQDTDPDGIFTLQRVACLGCCTIAPVVQIDDVTYGHVKTNNVSKILQDFLLYQIKKVEQKTSEKKYSEEFGEIRIGLGSCCVASGSSKVKQELENSLIETGIQTQVKRVGCVGMCHRTPLLEVITPNNEPVLYDKVQPEEVKRLLLKHYEPKSIKKRVTNTATGFLENILNDNYSNSLIHHSINTRDSQIESFLGRQIHIATEYSGQIDPLDLREYRSRNGFEALKRCLTEYTPEKIIETIKSSGLRGRGGAGFPTGKKWDITHRVKDKKKYIICNGDEGDPGAFMDRMILESYPFRVIEGMIIAAFTVGAHEGIFYIRAEYPLAVERVNNAICQCEETGLLGENILDSGFSLT